MLVSFIFANKADYERLLQDRNIDDNDSELFPIRSSSSQNEGPWYIYLDLNEAEIENVQTQYNATVEKDAAFDWETPHQGSPACEL